ncbi:hypothetical protein Vadar_033520 [Vaccinium darrowii]|uniref:Uncharacterized protein n=1 Tax=Vaccinium darrowii TaxID=229202 RepID=A0ACB7Y4E8_9ERIC|nr:hypothetical protein Vadar_033520 [Vaccinium darrowii]
MEEGACDTVNNNSSLCMSTSVVTMTKKAIAEVIGTSFVIFSGCGAVVVNDLYGGTITFPGVCIVWGLVVMVMIYTVGHISGAHFNPAVTITFALFRRFPWREVPIYVGAQFVGSILASGVLCLMFDVTSKAYFGTVPVGSDRQSLGIEIIITFFLMFVISGVATDNRAIGELAGLAVGSTIMLNVFVAGPISGASMNPARSIGPAIVKHVYKGLWVYIVGPLLGAIAGGPISGASMNPARSIGPAIVKHVYKGLWVYIVGPLLGAIAGGFAYNLIRQTDKPLGELAKTTSIFRSLSKS